MLVIELKEPLFIQWLTIQDKLHRYHQPARTSWWEPGQLCRKEYWVNGKWHRDSTKGPAFQYWHPNGQLCRKEYLVNGKWHRDPREGSASQSWYETGQLQHEEYWLEDKKVNKPC